MFRFLAAALLSFTVAAGPASAQTKSAFSAAQKAELEALVKQYITDHPEVMISSVESYYNKQQNNKAKQEGKLEQIPPNLYDDPNTPFVGPKNAKVSVVEFFDYNCGYCKQVASDVTRLADEEKAEVRFIFKELPILSDTSEVAARHALAANKQGKYLEYHNALMNHQGPITEDYLLAAAKDVGLDVEKLKKDAASQDVRDTLQKNVELARTLGVRGTPFFLIGKEKVPGAVGYTQMKDLLNKERGIAPVVTPSVDTSTSTTTTTTTAPSPVEPTKNVTGVVSTDPEVQAEIDKAKAEAQAMIDEIKKQAADLQKQAIEADAAAKAKAAADAKAAAAKKE